MDLDRQRPVGDEETVAVIGATVRLATHALDGLEISDEELDCLCDAVLNKSLDQQKDGRSMVEDRSSMAARYRNDSETRIENIRFRPDGSYSGEGTCQEPTRHEPAHERQEQEHRESRGNPEKTVEPGSQRIRLL